MSARRVTLTITVPAAPDNRVADEVVASVFTVLANTAASLVRNFDAGMDPSVTVYGVDDEPEVDALDEHAEQHRQLIAREAEVRAGDGQLTDREAEARYLRATPAPGELS